MELQGKTCLITGASRGIGRALTERLAREPLDLLLLGLRDPDGYEPPAGAAREIRPVRLDLSSRESIDDGLDGIEAEIDLLVNNAGQFTGGLLETQDLDEIYAMAQVNFIAPMHLVKRLLPPMLARGEGKIVNQASVVGYAFFPGVTTYSATKAGIVGFSQSLRRELKDTGVSVLELATGGVDTDMMERVKKELDPHANTSGWDQYEPDEWAEKVVEAISSDDTLLGPGGKAALAKLASRGPGGLLDGAASAGFER